MLFNTYFFAFIFLPIALLGYFQLSKFNIRLSISFLLLCSVVFYGYWDSRFIPLLLGSVTTNFFIGKAISKRKESNNDRRAKTYLIAGLIFNLSLLSFFKYLDFLIANIALVTGSPLLPLGIILPIGISFFTFTQIAYLVDCHSAEVRDYHPESFGLFVTYFPHLIAGPILHHKEMMPQFDLSDSHKYRHGRLVIGTTFFVIGLFKKVILADGVARFVGPVFDINHSQLTMIEAWCGALAYTFQLYFDFSAYSDMAYGLSYMFGIVLPINFNSPYKATSIVEFWRRWHITLSRFLRDYLYVPLGGNRRGQTRRHINLLATMLLGGLWHGANWTFVIWGGLHGIYLIVNHEFRKLIGERDCLVVRATGWVMTFLAVVVGWVFFRATSYGVAIDVLQGMFFGTHVGAIEASPLGINRIMAIDECAFWLGATSAVAFFMPNAYQLIGFGLRYAEEERLGGVVGGLFFGGVLSLIFLLLAISETRGVSEFLYFNF